jgi:hypothetical protein
MGNDESKEKESKKANEWGGRINMTYFLRPRQKKGKKKKKKAALPIQ